ncbi:MULTISPECIES: hypothetical protein [Ralstonia]|uniref:Nmad2 family putative nucleotide modification protein n=1 Tax=Ralstonia TaxID=48736 RepID=UPI0013642F5E|nr:MULTISPECIES: hypothetical protein [Ralstonia]MBY4707051.1 hypothetical protein [Ralstonia insidiosa]
MTTRSCYTSSEAPAPRKGCRSDCQRGESPVYTADSLNLSIEALRLRIAQIGAPDEERVYAYVVRSVRPREGQYLQTGSAPNFDGGLITLCTCKHSMRASLTPEQWMKGIWVAGLTSWDKAFSKQQSLVYLMRVGEAYASQAELVYALRRSGRSAVVDAKDSTKNCLGDLMMPATASLPAAESFTPSAYLKPMLGHAHRQTETDDGWQYDINYPSRSGSQPAMLVGDEQLSFAWTRPTVQRRRPGPTRPYREWTLTALLDDLEAVTE